MTTGSPDWSPKIVSSGSATQNAKADVTDGETVVTFDQQVLSFIIYNDGPYSIHLSRATDVDTDDFKIPSGSFWVVDVPTISVYLICDTDETATCYLVGIF